MTVVLEDLEAVRGAAGLDLGTTEWVEIDQDRLARFDAALRGGGGPPVAPVATENLAEYLVLSLTNMFLPLLVEVQQVVMVVNYGSDRVRFPARAPLGARLRASGRIAEILGIVGGMQTTIRVTVEAEGTLEPVCVVDAVSRWME